MFEFTKTLEWQSGVDMIETLIEEAGLTEDQIDHILAIPDCAFDGQWEKVNKRLAYWADKIGLDRQCKNWIFEWAMS